MQSEEVIVNIFCGNLRRLRKAKEVTQEEMAAMLGMTQSSYSKLERGSFAPSIVTVSRVAQCLGTNAAELLIPGQEKQESEKRISSQI